MLDTALQPYTDIAIVVLKKITIATWLQKHHIQCYHHCHHPSCNPHYNHPQGSGRYAGHSTSTIHWHCRPVHRRPGRFHHQVPLSPFCPALSFVFVYWRTNRCQNTNKKSVDSFVITILICATINKTIIKRFDIVGPNSFIKRVWMSFAIKINIIIMLKFTKIALIVSH